MSGTFIKLDRSLLHHRYFDNVNVLKIWLYLLMKASHAPHKQLVGNSTVNLEVGDLIFGRIAASRDLKMSEQTVRTIIKLLENDKKITIKSTNKYSIITVIKFEAYQVEKYKNNQQDNQLLTINQPATNQQLTTNKNVKNVKNVKNKNLSPSDDEVNGEEVWLSKKKRTLTGKRLDTFKRFWDAFNLKDNRAETIDAWLDIPQLTNSLVDTIVEAAEAEARGRPALINQGKTPKMAQGWLSGRRWENQRYSQSEGGVNNDFKTSFLAGD